MTANEAEQRLENVITTPGMSAAEAEAQIESVLREMWRWSYSETQSIQSGLECANRKLARLRARERQAARKKAGGK